MKIMSGFLKIGILSLLAIVIPTAFVNAQPVSNTPLIGGLHHNTFSGSLNASEELYVQVYPVSNNIASQDFEADLDDADCKAADDFIVPAGKTWSIDEVAIGFTYSGTFPTPTVNINVQFFNDNAGVPGTLIQEFVNLPINSSQLLATGSISLPTPVYLEEGVKWISIQFSYSYNSFGQSYLDCSSVQTGNASKWINPGNHFGRGTNWINSSIPSPSSVDFCFILYGTESKAVPFPLIGSILAFLGIGGASFFGLRKRRK
jgi:hypothetical protein